MKRININLLILFVFSISVANAENTGYTVRVSDVLKQPVKFGVDAERLWYWKSALKSQLATLAVNDMKPEFVRVAIACDYEREKGVIKTSAYDQILEMMTAMKNANPNILFFATPRPLQEAYTNEEAIAEWGSVDNIPWSPYPRWILEWNQNGTKTLSDGSVVPNWVQGNFDIPALVQYYADYLNFMYSKGFYIDYIDATNEKNIITPAINKYLYDNVPLKLNPGVKMPKLIVPSAWNVQGGINWLDTVDTSKGEQLAFEVAAVHNTGEGGTPEDFVNAANSLGKEPWNSELHNWIGVTLYDEVINSEVFWKYMRAGFVGIETWLFYGPAAGKPHSMIWVGNTTITKSGKYEIFKQVVNNANNGNFINASIPTDAFVTAAFLKDSIMSVWILNKQSANANSTTIELMGSKNIAGKTIQITRWKGGETTNEGEKSTITAVEQNKFNVDIKGESLYFFRINVANTTKLQLVEKESPHIIVRQSNSESILIDLLDINQWQNIDYVIYNLMGRVVHSGHFTGNNIEIRKPDFTKGIYFISIISKNINLNSTFIVS